MDSYFSKYMQNIIDIKIWQTFVLLNNLQKNLNTKIWQTLMRGTRTVTLLYVGDSQSDLNMTLLTFAI